MTESILAQFLDEYQKLKAKADFADELLQYYDRETMTFDIPDKWRNASKFTSDVLGTLPASPRHSIALKMQEVFTYSEIEHKLPWDRLDEKAA